LREFSGYLDPPYGSGPEVMIAGEKNRGMNHGKAQRKFVSEAQYRQTLAPYIPPLEASGFYGAFHKRKSFFLK
jgi:hypothetical protein